MNKTMYLLLAMCCFTGIRAVFGLSSNRNVLVYNDGPNAVFIVYERSDGSTATAPRIAPGQAFMPGNTGQIRVLAFLPDNLISDKATLIDLNTIASSSAIQSADPGAGILITLSKSKGQPQWEHKAGTFSLE